MKLRLDTGDSAEGRAFDGEFFTLLGPRAYAPGSPIRFAALFDKGVCPLEGRALRSKRIDDGRFEVRLRLISLRREARERLFEHFGKGV